MKDEVVQDEVMKTTGRAPPEPPPSARMAKDGILGRGHSLSEGRRWGTGKAWFAKRRTQQQNCR